MTPQTLGAIGVYLSATLSTLSFVGFVTMARFWRSGRGGWLVFWDLLMVSWLLDLATIHSLFGDSPGFAWLRAASFAIGFPLVLAWRLWIIFDLQLRGRLRQLMAYGGGRHHPAGQEEATE